MAHFLLPDLGEGLQEAEIVEWHVKEGDTIKEDDNLLSVETAKAIVDIPAPKSGVVARCFVKEGDIVHIGEPLLAFEGDEEGTSHSVVGELKSDAQGAADSFVAGAVTTINRSAAATPATRALARHLSVDVEKLDGSGPEGAVTLDDVQREARRHATHMPKIDGEPLRGVSRSMAKAMTAAGQQVVPVSLFDQVSIGHWPAKTDIMVRIIRAIAAGCEAEPKANAWFDGDAMVLKQIEKVDLGIAVDTPDGLFVPVMHNIVNRDDADLRGGLQLLRKYVTERSIPPKELQGATITISNFGTLGGRFATPVVVPPQVVIVGVGRAFTQPAIKDGALVDDKVMPISVTFDHRVLNGGEAARFLASVMASLAG